MNKTIFKTILVYTALTLSPVAFAQPTHNAPAEPPAMDTKGGNEVAGSIKSPHVSFVSPHEGETVARELTAQFAVDGLKIAPASGTAVPGEGHFYLVVDGKPTAKNDVAPEHDGKESFHFNNGETEKKLKLTRGSHTLTLQFLDGAHHAYGDKLTASIQIKVK